MRAEGPRGLSDITRYCCQADIEKCTEIQSEHPQNQGIFPKNAGADALSPVCLRAGEERGGAPEHRQIWKTSNNSTGGTWASDEELIWHQHKCERERLVQLR